MSHAVLVLLWSTLTIFMGANVYIELSTLKFLTFQSTTLLGRFPLHTTVCCDNECNNPISQGYTTESYTTDDNEFLSYHEFEDIKIFSKVFFKDYNITLWNGKVSGQQGFIDPSAVEEKLFYCIPEKQLVFCSTMTCCNFTKLKSERKAKAKEEAKLELLVESRRTEIMKINDSTNDVEVTPSVNHQQIPCTLHCVEFVLPTINYSYYANAPISHHPKLNKKAAEYPLRIITQQNQWTGLVEMLYLGFILTCLLGITAVVHSTATFLMDFFQTIWIWIKLNFLNYCSYSLSPQQVLISVESLQYFKSSLEQLHQQNKINFRQGRQYFNTGVRINAEKNIIKAENEALNRELTYLKAKLSNQRFYIQQLEQQHNKVCNRLHTYSMMIMRALKEQLNSESLINETSLHENLRTKEMPNLVSNQATDIDELEAMIKPFNKKNQFFSNISDIIDHENRTKIALELFSAGTTSSGLSLGTYIEKLFNSQKE